MTDTKKWQKALSIICAVFLLSYIIYQGYMIAYNPVTTETAYKYTQKDSYETDVFVVRDESYITANVSGTLVSIAEDGTRVANGQEVALVFASQEAASNYSQLQSVENDIARYTKLLNTSKSYAFDLDTLDDRINASVFDYIEEIDDKSYQSLSEYSDSIRDNTITRQLAVGTELSLDEKLSSLQKEKQALESKDTSHTGITAGSSGYYISVADGYENTVSYKDVTSLTVDDVAKLKDAKPSKVSSDVMGKLVEDFTWYMVCNVPSNSIENLDVGDKITVSFPASSVDNIEAEVVSVSGSSSKKVSVVLSSNLMNSGIANLRKESARLILNEYTGLKIKNSAVRVNAAGEKGVYVLRGNVARFKLIDSVYSGKDYFISKIHSDSSKYVKMYDSVIVEGKDLYDGKVIK